MVLDKAAMSLGHPHEAFGALGHDKLDEAIAGFEPLPEEFPFNAQGKAEVPRERIERSVVRFKGVNELPAHTKG